MNENQEITETPEIPEMDNTPLTKPKRKINAPRTEKQIAHTEKMRAKRSENIEKKKQQKEVQMAKIYMENKLKEQEQAEPKEEPIKKPVKKTVKYVEEENDDEEEEIVYVKKKKKPVKKKIIYLSDSDDDGGDIPPPKLERQTNSRVMRKEPEPQKPEPSVNYNDYFI